MKPASVMILGGSGYIGPALTRYLREQGLAVTCIDMAVRNSSVCDLRRRVQDLTVRELAAHDGVVLLAGHSSVAACDKQPTEAFANNVTAFGDLIQKIGRAHV